MKELEEILLKVVRNSFNILILFLLLFITNFSYAEMNLEDKEVVLNVINSSLSEDTKLDLNAVVLESNLEQEKEVEEPEFETYRQIVHKALHGEVSKIDPKPLLDKYLNKKFERGPLSNISISNYYRGSFQNIWENEEYKNTIYSNNFMYTIIQGKFKNPKFGFRSMYLWTPGKPNHDFFNDVWGDQYLTYNFAKNDQVLVGYSRYDNGIEGNMAPHLLPFFTRTQIAKAYGDARNLGAKVSGKHKYINYSAGIFSSGRAFYDWLPGQELVANMGVKPLAKFDSKYGDLLIGTSFDGGNADGGNVYNVGNAYLDYEYKRLKLTCEYGLADGSNGSSGFTKNKSEGLNATVAYRLTNKIQTLFRYDWFDSNKDISNNARTEYTVGLNYFLIGEALRFMINYTGYNIQNGTYGSRIYAGTQVIL